MKYQLVLQWPSVGLKKFDELISLEDKLIKDLGNRAMVDGHDIGKDEANIFILTDDPPATFKIVRKSLDLKNKSQMKAAYRKISSDDYEPIWPPGLPSFRVS